MLPLMDRGTGEPTFVLMHFFGNSHREWLEVVPHLEDTYRCVALDLPGFGDAAGESRFDVRSMADRVEATIEGLSLSRVVLVGHSFSGKIAMLLASRRPAWLESLILVAPAPAGPQPVSDEERRFQEAFDHGRAQAESFIEGAVTAEISAERYEAGVEDAMRASPEAWQAWPRSGSREDFAEEVGIIDYPTIVIVGDQDPSLPPQTQRELVLNQFRAPRFEIMPGFGHLLPMEMPQTLAGLMRAFIELKPEHKGAPQGS